MPSSSRIGTAEHRSQEVRRLVAIQQYQPRLGRRHQPVEPDTDCGENDSECARRDSHAVLVQERIARELVRQDLRLRQAANAEQQVERPRHEISDACPFCLLHD